jgi:hypothetical protein
MANKEGPKEKIQRDSTYGRKNRIEQTEGRKRTQTKQLTKAPHLQNSIQNHSEKNSEC